MLNLNSIKESIKKLTSILSVRLIGYSLTLLVLLLYLTGNQLLDTLENKTYDMRMVAEGVREPGGEVVIASIDEKSIDSLGRWPWSRNIIARLISKLDKLGPKVIVLDVFFPEPENKDLLDLINGLEKRKGYSSRNTPFKEIRKSLAADRNLASAIQKSGKVVLAITSMSDTEVKHLSEADLFKAFESVERQSVRIIRDRGDGKLDFPMHNNPAASGLLVNLPELQSAAKYAGHITTHPDPDGTLRWVPLVIKYKDYFFPSGDLQAVRAYLDADEVILQTLETGINGIQVGNVKTLPTDENGRMLVHYHGPEATFPTHSVVDLLSGKVPADAIKDKIVIIGTSAKGIGDIRTTPYGPSFPGVEIRANVIQNLIDGDSIQRPGWMKIFDVLIILFLGIVLSHVLPRIGVRRGAIGVSVLIVGYLALTVVIFSSEKIWLNMVYPTVLMTVLFMFMNMYHYFSSEAERRQIKGAFQHYVPTTVVEEIVNNVEKLHLGGEKRELTVLFSDVRGFTTLSETMQPEELVSLLNTYLTKMTEQVFNHDGTLDKYIGDAIMAVYGAPVVRDDHAVLACRTAVDMMNELAQLQAEWKKQSLPSIDIGIGINTGPMIVGNMGSEILFDYTVIGDAVNLGSRIEHLNKTYGTHILISEFTYEQVKNEFPHIREIDVTTVRGRREPVGLYEIMLEKQYDNMDWVDQFRRAYHLFQAGDIDNAQLLFEDISRTVDDPVCRYYIERCEQEDVIDID